jgi:hypothetical protein
MLMRRRCTRYSGAMRKWLHGWCETTGLQSHLEHPSRRHGHGMRPDGSYRRGVPNHPGRTSAGNVRAPIAAFREPWDNLSFMGTFRAQASKTEKGAVLSPRPSWLVPSPASVPSDPLPVPDSHSIGASRLPMMHVAALGSLLAVPAESQ